MVDRLIFIVVNDDWFFLSHRLPIALAARQAGARIVVVARDTGRSAEIRGHGLDFVALPIASVGLNPLADIRTLAFLVRLYRRSSPDLVHHVTVKPMLYGSLAARVVDDGIAVVNAVSGQGFLFSSDYRARFLLSIVSKLYKTALGYPNSRTIFQNPEDLSDFVKLGFASRHTSRLIRGSGVDCEVFRPRPEPAGAPVVLLASRLRWEKGLREFAELARWAGNNGLEARFVLAGGVGEGGVSAVPRETVEGWVREGILEWWGLRDDMPAVISKASVVVLPTTYREGVPKVLLEAAAAGRPIVATDVRGCREVVQHGINGLLVQPGDARALASAVEKLLASPALRNRYGRAGRQLAETEFSIESVTRRTLDIYRELLDAAPAALPKSSVGNDDGGCRDERGSQDTRVAGKP